MAVTVSLVLLLLVLTAIFLRAKTLKVSHAVICVVLGFLLASTSLAPTIQSGIVATAQVMSNLHP